MTGGGTTLQTPSADSALAAVMASLQRPHVLVDHRLIAPGDEQALCPGEAEFFQTSVLQVRRQSGAARMVARRLLRDFGLQEVPLPRSASGAPVWPPGVVGSLAHDASVAVAAVARRDHVAGLGIDVEPDEPLPANLLDLVTTPEERRRHHLSLRQGRLLFSIKEAVYKALCGIDGVLLGFHDIEIELGRAEGCATVSRRRRVPFAYVTRPRIVALAYLE